MTLNVHAQDIITIFRDQSESKFTCEGMKSLHSNLFKFHTQCFGVDWPPLPATMRLLLRGRRSLVLSVAFLMVIYVM